MSAVQKAAASPGPLCSFQLPATKGRPRIGAS
jgi:hypothetical protein